MHGFLLYFTESLHPRPQSQRSGVPWTKKRRPAPLPAPAVPVPLRIPAVELQQKEIKSLIRFGSKTSMLALSICRVIFFYLLS